MLHKWLKLASAAGLILGCLCQQIDDSPYEESDHNNFAISFADENRILADSYTLLPELLTQLFTDSKVIECLGPHVCNLLGSRSYYDPYKAKCVKRSLFSTGAKPYYPELLASCSSPYSSFAEYIAANPPAAEQTQAAAQ